MSGRTSRSRAFLAQGGWLRGGFGDVQVADHSGRSSRGSEPIFEPSEPLEAGAWVVETTTNLKVSLASGPPTGPDLRIKQENWDHAKDHKDQRTSLRFFGANPRGELKPRRFSIDPGDGRYFTRDRDLGQSFTTPAGGSFRVEAITLRTSP